MYTYDFFLPFYSTLGSEVVAVCFCLCVECVALLYCIFWCVGVRVCLCVKMKYEYYEVLLSASMGSVLVGSHGERRFISHVQLLFIVGVSFTHAKVEGCCG